MSDYSQKELQELYDNLPEDLQEALFSQKVADEIYKISSRNELKDDEKINQVSKYVGHVLLGIIPPNELAKTLKKEIKTTTDTAEKISSEINDSIFLSIKGSLEALYGIKIKSARTRKIIRKTAEKISPSFKKPIKKDGYREIIE